MNRVTQNILSAAAGGLTVLALTFSPLFAQNKTTTPTPASHTTAEAPAQHQQMKTDKNKNENKKCCESMMAKGMMDKNKSTTDPHKQHQPKNTKPTTASSAKPSVNR